MTAQNATSDITNGGSSERTVRYMFVVPENRAVISFPLTKLCFLFSLLEDEEYYPHFDAEQRAQITGALETMVDHRPLKPWQPTYLDLLAKLEEAVDSWPQFEAPDDEEQPVTGSELVDWFAGWRKETKALALTARAEFEGVVKTSTEDEIAALKNSLADARSLVALLVAAWPSSGHELADRVNQLRTWAEIPA